VHADVRLQPAAADAIIIPPRLTQAIGEEAKSLRKAKAVAYLMEQA
jgi:hypothetical protein